MIRCKCRFWYLQNNRNHKALSSNTQGFFVRRLHMEGNRDEQYMKQALQLAQKGEGYGAQSNGRSCHCKRRSHHRKWIPRTLWRTACGSKCHCRCQRRCGRCNHVCYFRAMFSLWENASLVQIYW